MLRQPLESGIVTRRHLFVALAIVSLVLVNLLADVGLMWLSDKYFRGSSWLDIIPVGVILGQLLLLALWLGLGDGRWYLRLVVSVALTLSMAKTIGIAELLSSRSRQDYNPGRSMMIAFMFLAMLLATSCFAFVLRRMRSWRLTWQEIVSGPATSQFQVGDTLMWMIVIGGALASIRFLVTIDEDFPSQFLDIGVFSVKTTMVVLGAMAAAFSTRRVRAVIFLALAVLLIGATFAVPDAYDSVQRMRASATIPVPFYRYAVAWGNQTLKHETFVVAAAVTALANCLALAPSAASLYGLADYFKAPDVATVNA